MGEIAEQMLDGSLCEGCGVYLGEAVGYPRRCHSCMKAQRADAVRPDRYARPRQQKITCPVCSKKVTIVGLAHHIYDKHVKNAIPGGK